MCAQLMCREGVAVKLTDMVAAHKRAKKDKRGSNRAIVLSLKSDIQEALVDGWSIRSIWETLYERGKITFGYRTFLRYVTSIIRRDPTSPATSNQPTDDTSKEKPEDVKQTQPAGIPGFKFDPIPPKKEDLF